MAVCIVCVLTNIFECSVSLNLVLVYGSVIFVCDAVTVCRDYIVVTCSTFRFTRENYSCFVSNDFNIANHWSGWFLILCCSIDSLRTSIVLAVFLSCYSNFTIFLLYSVFGCFNINTTTFNSNFVTVYGYICICKVEFINSPIFRNSSVCSVAVLSYNFYC